MTACRALVALLLTAATMLSVGCTKPKALEPGATTTVQLEAPGGAATEPAAAKTVEAERPRSSPPALGRVLDEQLGKTGLVRVEELEGHRLLTVNGTIQAQVPVETRPLRLVDPIAEIATRVTPNAKTALVIGLGSGMTSRALANAGIDTLAVEIEHVVVSFARKYFAFKGKAVVADGLDYLKRSPERFDLNLLDAFVGYQAPAHLVSEEAFALMKKRLTDKGVLIVHLLGSPAEERVAAVADRFSGDDHYRVLGNGPLRSEQDLYLVYNSACISDLEGHWVHNGDELWSSWSYLEPVWPADKHEAAKRLPWQVHLVGYLSIVDPSQRSERSTQTDSPGRRRVLRVHVPWPSMGANVFELVGPLTARLEKILSEKMTAASLYRILGNGGNIQGNATQPSPVVVSLQGIVTQRCQLDCSPRSRRILGGWGAFHRLEVSEINWSLSLTEWMKLERQDITPGENAAKLFENSGDYHAAANRVNDVLAALRAKFGKTVEALIPYDRLLCLSECLQDKADGKALRGRRWRLDRPSDSCFNLAHY